MDKGESKTIKDGDTITLDELVWRMRASANYPGTKKVNRVLLLNAASALVSLGQRIEALDAQLAETTNRPAIVGPGGNRVN